jgi:hypothetical protein
MSSGAALAFLVSGNAVSIWGVLAVVPILRPKGSQMKITAGFVPNEHEGRSLWRGWLPWTIYYAQNFNIFLDTSESII